jgi:DNA-binding CsgD family transcriptional regulator
MESYLRHVATRWAGYRPLRDGGRSRDLTAREREILERLAADEDLHAIAGALGISYITVRNHVQHILRKLAVRSIAEAVASSILSNGEESDDLTPGVSPAAPPPSRAPGRHSLLKAR